MIRVFPDHDMWNCWTSPDAELNMPFPAYELYFQTGDGERRMEDWQIIPDTGVVYRDTIAHSYYRRKEGSNQR